MSINYQIVQYFLTAFIEDLMPARSRPLAKSLVVGNSISKTPAKAAIDATPARMIAQQGAAKVG